MEEANIVRMRLMPTVRHEYLEIAAVTTETCPKSLAQIAQHEAFSPVGRVIPAAA